MSTPSIGSTRSLLHRLYRGDATLVERTLFTIKNAWYEAPDYLRSFIPSLSWFMRYNRSWLVCDMIAGITVAMMVVPQSLAYAKLANLPLIYGLYSSFIGTMIYSFTGTSREIAVGPTAVLSLLVGDILNSLSEKFPDLSLNEIASAISLVGGVLMMALGALRLSIVLDLIPSPVILGFTTGSSFVIISTQISNLLGVPHVLGTDHAPKIISSFFSHFLELNWHDLIFGLSSLVLIILLNLVSRSLSLRFPFLSYLRIASNAIAVVFFSLISFIASNRDDFELKIVGALPKGFPPIQAPNLNSDLLFEIMKEIIPVILIALLEHISVGKAFARKNGYHLNASQECFSLGLGNMIASFFCGYPVTGSFSRTAVNANSGVKTPLGGLWTGLIVMFTLWFLTPAFYFLPSATLSAIIIVSATSLIPSVQTIKSLLLIQPHDFFIFLIAVIITFTLGSEMGILISCGLSFMILLYQVARPRFYLLAEIIDRPGVFVDSHHPSYETSNPLPGVVIFRPQESIIFPNIDYLKDWLFDVIFETTRPGVSGLPSEVLWSEASNNRGQILREKRAFRERKQPVSESSLPFLRAIVFDFGSVNLIDSSGLQGLFDIRESIAKYTKYTPEQERHDSNIEEKDHESRIKCKPCELHFVSAHPRVLRTLEVSGITTPLNESSPNTPSHSFTSGSIIEPIVSTSSRFVHITMVDAITKIQEHFNQ